VGVGSVAALCEHFGEIPRTAPLAYWGGFAARPIAGKSGAAKELS
jgi:hypothetical protein